MGPTPVILRRTVRSHILDAILFPAISAHASHTLDSVEKDNAVTNAIPIVPVNSIAAVQLV